MKKTAEAGFCLVAEAGLELPLTKLGLNQNILSIILKRNFKHLSAYEIRKIST
jgi:hypothetical protein